MEPHCQVGVWYNSKATRGTIKQSDLLSPFLLNTCSGIISSANHSKDLVQGPMRALRAALDRLGWTMVSVCTIRDQQNVSFDLTASSPPMLMHYAKEAYMKYQMNMATMHLVQKQRYPKEANFRWKPIIHLSLIHI